MSSLKEAVAERRAAQAAGASHAISSSPAATLVVSTWQGETWVLPWAQMTKAHFGGSSAPERLELSFPHLLVIMHGYRLRGLLDDLAAFRLSTLRDFPPDYHPPGEAGEPFVARIEVRPLPGHEIREPSS